MALSNRHSSFSTLSPPVGSHNSSSSSAATPSELTANYPILVTPNSLQFFPSPSGSWNVEMLTVYNPLPFALQIKVLCTRAAAYAVNPSFFSLPAQTSMKVSVRMRSSLLEEQQRAESRAKSKDKFMIEQYDLKGNLQNKLILTAQISTQINPTAKPISTSSSPLADSLTSPAGFPNASAASGLSSASSSLPQNSRLWWLYLLTLPLRLFPLLLGILLIYCLHSGVIQLSDPHATLWLSFFIGFITCVIQLKFVESAKAI